MPEILVFQPLPHPKFALPVTTQLHGAVARAATLPFLLLTLLALAGCETDQAPAVVGSLQAASSASQPGVVGVAVAFPPAVRVLDVNGDAISGAEVNWSVMLGNGSLSSGTTISGAQGVATLSSWIMGTAVGENVVRASVPGVQPVFFQAIAAAGAVAVFEEVEGDNQSLLVGQTVPIRPAVRVVDQFGNGIASVPVNFQLISGGGVITGASQDTDEDGLARIGSWRLGAQEGVNQIGAHTVGFAPLSFHATAAISPRCETETPFALFAPFNGVLTEQDCLFPNKYYHDFLSTLVPSTQALRFVLSSSTMDPYLLVLDANGRLVAEDDNGAGGFTNAAAVTVIAPGGPIGVAASSAIEFELGNYSLTSQTASSNVSGCDLALMHIMRGVTVAQNLAASDCIDTGGPFYFDEFKLYLVSGESVTITSTSSVVDTYLEVFLGGNTVAVNDDISDTDFNARVTFTPSESNFYLLYASSHAPQEIGTYTLSISAPPPMAMGAAGAASTGAVRTLERALFKRGVISRRR